MKEVVFSSPFFGISISIFAFAIGTVINKKTKIALLNPLLISYVIIIAFMVIFDIPLEWYNNGGDFINLFLTPATAVLALTIYRQRDLIKKNFITITIATFVGSLTSIISVVALCKLFALSDTLTYSLIPKSITTPMAIAVSSSLGGIQSITVLTVIITGISGNILAPLLMKLFKVDDPLVQGVALGTSSHAIGTSKAVELGEIQGAVSSVALTFTGIITVVLSLFVTYFI